MIIKSLTQTPELATIPALAPFLIESCVIVTNIGPSNIANVNPNNMPWSIRLKFLFFEKVVQVQYSKLSKKPIILFINVFYFYHLTDIQVRFENDLLLETSIIIVYCHRIGWSSSYIISMKDEVVLTFFI